MVSKVLKIIITLLCLFQIPVNAEVYRYPEKVDIDVACEGNITALELIEGEYQAWTKLDCPYVPMKIKAVDLN